MSAASGAGGGGLSYSHYRASSIGRSLVTALEQLVDDGDITQEEAVPIMLNFDKSITQQFATVKNEIRIEGLCNTYRHQSRIWEFFVYGASFGLGFGGSLRPDTVEEFVRYGAVDRQAYLENVVLKNTNNNNNSRNYKQNNFGETSIPVKIVACEAPKQSKQPKNKTT